jgi:aryl-alcohol dehydrogenase-like predicted oxidoreductase
LRPERVDAGAGQARLGWVRSGAPRAATCVRWSSAWSGGGLDAADFQRSSPRFAGDNFQANWRIVETIGQIAAEAGATPAQVALRWLLAQGDDIVPIPGTRRIERAEENAGADAVDLSAGQLDRLSALEPPVGDRYADMTTINR